MRLHFHVTWTLNCASTTDSAEVCLHRRRRAHDDRGSPSKAAPAVELRPETQYQASPTSRSSPIGRFLERSLGAGTPA